VLRSLLAESPSKSPSSNSDVASSPVAFGRFLGRDCQTVINLVQSSQIKIACRSSDIQRAILTVDESQHSIAFLSPITRIGTSRRPIQAAHFTYFLFVSKEKTDQFSMTIRANTPLKTRTCTPSRLVIHRYVLLCRVVTDARCGASARLSLSIHAFRDLKFSQLDSVI
jgi:hypothetical protein